MRRPNYHILKSITLCVSLVTFCEFIFYYVVISQCSWPLLHEREADHTIYLPPEENVPVRAMIIADVHLLGSLKGHWFDKLRREWQMYRSFQTAISLYKPEVIFILGDLFDEGLWCSDQEFNYYVERFHMLFHVPEDTDLFVVVGNHDIGFHYGISPYLSERFISAFKSPSVQLISIRGNHFVLINSMAMEGDGCFLCRPAQIQLTQIANKLKCTKGIGKCSPKMNLKQYSRPILLQHFPMHRQSDIICSEPDEAPEDSKKQEFRERWECLSREASEMIYDNLRPRLIVNGHTHHGCHVVHRQDIHEYTLPSFNWRNKNNPSFMLAVLAPNNYAVKKCWIPQESTVITLYCFGGFVIAIWTLLLYRQNYSPSMVFRRRYLLKTILKRVNQIYRVQLHHSIQLDCLTAGQPRELSGRLSVEFTNKLPINNINDFDALENNLAADENMKIRLVDHLTRVGGTGVMDTTRRIMRRLLTDNVAQHYSYRGMKMKRRFDRLLLREVIFDSVRRNPSSSMATDVEMEKIVMDHLKHAKTRLHSKKLNTPTVPRVLEESKEWQFHT